MNEANHQPDPTLRAQMIALAHHAAGENFHLADLPYRFRSRAPGFTATELILMFRKKYP